MRPDVKIAIAYGSNAQSKVADLLKNKLLAYQKQGYPVSVSIVKEDIEELKKNLPSGANPETAIRKRMEKYFSGFDYAIFLFDTKGKAIPEGETEESPLISSNLIFEYGLASSAFINQELKTIYCFAPAEITGKALQYVKNFNFKYFSEILKEKANDIEAQTDLIIQDYIHCNKYNKTGIYFSFYGLPEVLPKLDKNQQGEFIVQGDIQISDPMSDKSDNNNYWADLRKLQPAGIRVSLDTQDNALNELFKKEYQRFYDAPENQTEHILGRSLLYIIDRAVFIMYLRQEDYWDDVVYNGYANPQNPHSQRKSLYEVRLDYLKSRNLNIGNDYYIKAIKALHGVFLYQKYSRPEKKDKPLSGKLLKDNNLDEIGSFLYPAFELGSGAANRMIFCLAADYLALVKHKLATKTLGEFIGEKEFCLDNMEHMNKLTNALKKYKNSEGKTDILKKVLETFYEAVTIFKQVVECQKMLQNEEYNFGYRYTWKSYALYNQARCEFMIYLIDSIYTKETSQSITTFVDNNIIETSKDWYDDLRQSVNSRKEDYEFFQKQPLFPQFITFNLQAEYYLAFYEYELSCLIEKELNPDFPTEAFTDYDKFEDWKNANLIITDVLSVDGKVARLNKFKEKSFDKDFAPIKNIIDNLPEDKKKIFTDWSENLKSAVISEDESKFNEIVKKGFEIEPEIGFDSMGPVAKIKLKFFYSKESSRSK